MEVDVNHTVNLIKINRNNLKILLNQRGLYTETLVPAHIMSSIETARDNIVRYKKILSGAGYTVGDVPGIDFDLQEELVTLSLPRDVYERLKMIAEAYDIII